MAAATDTPTPQQESFMALLAAQSERGRIRWYGSARGAGVLVARLGGVQCFVDDREAQEPATIRLVGRDGERRFAATTPGLVRLHNAARMQFQDTGVQLDSSRGGLG